MEPKIYGYARISRPQQSIDRQIRNIKSAYPDAVIVQEAYTGTRLDRPEWQKLYRKLNIGDMVVFDSVSRMNIPVQFEPAVRSLRATIPETQSHRYCHQKHYSTVLLT